MITSSYFSVSILFSVFLEFSSVMPVSLYDFYKCHTMDIVSERCKIQAYYLEFNLYLFLNSLMMWWNIARWQRKTILL